MKNKVKLAYLVSHPIQYQAPLLRRIAQEPDIDLTVYFGSDFSLRAYKDEGFGVGVEWDVPLVEGYKHEFLPVLRDTKTTTVTSPMNRGLWRRLQGLDGEHATGERFDALWVHGYSTVNAIHGMMAAKSLGIPVLLRAESWLKDRERRGTTLMAKEVFFAGLRQFVDAVLPIGTLNAAYWSYYLGETVPQFLMPYAVDNEYFQRRSAEARAGRAALQAELGIENGRPVVLFASKLQHRKRCEDLVSAYATLCREGTAWGRPYLLIVGDGEERKALERQVADAGLEDVRFCGFRNQSELPRFFDLASVFVLPSRHEPWGLIVNEVMNAGRAVIVSDDVGCHPDLIRDGVEGRLFPAGDVAGLTRALDGVLESADVAAAMGERARQRIAQWGFDEDVQGLRRALAAVTRKITA